jgi:hypothetical protein
LLSSFFHCGRIAALEVKIRLKMNTKQRNGGHSKQRNGGHSKHDRGLVNSIRCTNSCLLQVEGHQEVRHQDHRGGRSHQRHLRGVRLLQLPTPQLVRQALLMRLVRHPLQGYQEQVHIFICHISILTNFNFVSTYYLRNIFFSFIILHIIKQLLLKNLFFHNGLCAQALFMKIWLFANVFQI